MTYNISEAHTLGQAAAIERLKRFVAILRAEWGDQVDTVEREEWVGHVLHYRLVGIRRRVVEGTVTVADTAATVDGTVDRVPGFWRGRIDELVRTALRQALAP